MSCTFRSFHLFTIIMQPVGTWDLMEMGCFFYSFFFLLIVIWLIQKLMSWLAKESEAKHFTSAVYPLINVYIFKEEKTTKWVSHRIWQHFGVTLKAILNRQADFELGSAVSRNRTWFDNVGNTVNIVDNLWSVRIFVKKVTVSSLKLGLLVVHCKKNNRKWIKCVWTPNFKATIFDEILTWAIQQNCLIFAFTHLQQRNEFKEQSLLPCIFLRFQDISNKNSTTYILKLVQLKNCFSRKNITCVFQVCGSPLYI